MNDLEQFEKFPLLKNFQIGCRNINNKAIQHELERLIKIGHLKENFYNYNKMKTIYEKSVQEITRIKYINYDVLFIKMFIKCIMITILYMLL